MEIKNEKAIEAAVNWWAEAITNPKFDAGADSPQMAMAQMMALTMVKPISDDQLERFKGALSSLIKSDGFYGNISCDYHPDSVLSAALDEAGISSANVPWKTHMRISDESVTASYGYGSPTETVWNGD